MHLKKGFGAGCLGFPTRNVCVLVWSTGCSQGTAQECFISVCVLPLGCPSGHRGTQVQSRAGNGSLNIPEGWGELV